MLPPLSRRWALLAGVLYFAIIGLGLFGEAAVRGRLVVPGDPAATAAAIAAAPGLWRAGLAGDLLMHLFDLPVTVALYLLLRPVHAPLALLATAFNLVQTAVLAANKLLLVVPLLPGAGALAYPAIQLHGHGFAIGLLFFGATCVLRGVLIVHAGFMPKALGVLLFVAGLCYAANSSALLLAPALARALFPAILLPALVAELWLAGWLVLRGGRAAPVR